MCRKWNNRQQNRKQEQRMFQRCGVKWCQRVLKFCVVAVLFHAMAGVLNYIYVDEDQWFRNLWHYYYKAEGKIDQIYLGSSHVYCDINPAMLDELTGQYHFNLATSSQSLNGSYYLLKEAVHGNKLSHVYLELYYKCCVKCNSSEDSDPVNSKDYYSNNWNNTDYMKSSWNKLAYLHTIGDQEIYFDLLLPFVRFRQHLDDWEYVRQVLDKKKEPSYRAYQYRQDAADGNGYTLFTSQGYYCSTIQYLDEKRLYEQSAVLKENSLGEASEAYLRNIICYCKSKGIPITLFVSPIDHLQLVSTEGYDYYIRQLQDIAAEYGVDFYDFNLAKDTYLPVWEGKYFRDEGHLNSKGADIFTSFFHQVVSSEAGENERYFYKTYEEKLQKSQPDIYGLYYRENPSTDENTGPLRTYTIASNRSAGIKYQIVVKPDGGEESILQHFTDNKSFTLPAEEHGTCQITARMPKGDHKQQNEKKLTINY